MSEQPSQEMLDRFDESINDATHAVIAEFDWMDLPEGDEMFALMVRINDAITPILRDQLSTKRKKA